MRYKTLALALLLSFSATGEEWIPERAKQYQRTLIRAAQAEFGINAPVPALAAQIHKESAWRPDVCSPYACGLTQFTDDTANDAARKYEGLGPADVFNPNWAIMAMVLYDSDLKQQVDAINECNDWAFTLAMYNGGPGWIWKEKNIQQEYGERDQYWEGVELRNGGRKASAKEENVNYPRKILLELQHLYLEDGSWGSIMICSDGPTTADSEVQSIALEIVAEHVDTIEEITETKPVVKPDNPPKRTWKDWLLDIFK